MELSVFEVLPAFWWGFRLSGMWCCDTGQVVLDMSKEGSALCLLMPSKVSTTCVMTRCHILEDLNAAPDGLSCSIHPSFSAVSCAHLMCTADILWSWQAWKYSNCEIWGSHVGDSGHYVLLGCDAMQFGMWTQVCTHTRARTHTRAHTHTQTHTNKQKTNKQTHACPHSS